MYISHTVDTDEEDMLSNEFKTFDTFDHCLYNSQSRLSGLNYPVIKSICHQFIQYAIHSVQNASVKATQDQIEILRWWCWKAVLNLMEPEDILSLLLSYSVLIQMWFCLNTHATFYFQQVTKTQLWPFDANIVMIYLSYMIGQG